MTIWESLLYNVPELVTFLAAYAVLKAGRCTLLLAVLLLCIMILRGTVCREKVFVRGVLWCLVLPGLFGGTLKIFDENPVALKWLGWWTDVCASRMFVGYIYMFGVLTTAVYIVRQRVRLGKAISDMKQCSIMGRSIYVCEAQVTPFSAGLSKPAIIIPDFIHRTYSSEELAIIVQHEAAHIRLGHLWFYTCWDLLKIMFWFNPLIDVCRRFFKQDMEDICDRVAIQTSRCKPYAYGKLLLKSMQLLAGKGAGHSFPALLGKSSYRLFKERIARIMRYKPYKKEAAAYLIGCCLLAVMSGICFVKSVSYPSYTMDKMITVFSTSGSEIFIDDCTELHDAIQYDEDIVYIDNEKFKVFLDEKGLRGAEVYIGINGYYKIPHWGSGMNSIYVDYDELSGSKTQITYGNQYQYDVVTRIVQWTIKEVL